MSQSQGPERRRYDSSRRQEQASAQRRRILEVARQRFLESGYAATTLADVAAGKLPASVRGLLRDPEAWTRR